LSPLATAKDDRSDLKAVPRPLFLRDAYEFLGGPPRTNGTTVAGDAPAAQAASASGHAAPELPAVACERLTVTLEALPHLIRQGPGDLPSLTDHLCSRLIRLSNTYGLEGFESGRHAALLSLAVTKPSRRNAVRHLIAEFAADDVPLTTRLVILEVLCDAARELSNRIQAPAQECVSMKPVHDTVQQNPSKPVGRTRRFASATKLPESSPNYFAAELRYFLHPLLNRWVKPAKGAATWAMDDPALLAALLRSIAILAECAGSACPDLHSALAACIEMISLFQCHEEPQVRRNCLFLLSRVVLAQKQDVHLKLAEGDGVWVSVFDHLEASLLREGDQTCRQMAIGILAWLGRLPASVSS